LNPVVIVHMGAALIVVAGSIPLIAGRVKMNRWYGMRVPGAFVSEMRWTEINRYGGRLLLAWGTTMALTAVAGAFLGREHWLAYNCAALTVIVGGLVLVVASVTRYARKTNLV
jgi:uncharacterized membrane protein